MITVLLRMALCILRPIKRWLEKAVTRLEWIAFRRWLDAIPELRRIFATFKQMPEARWTIAEDDIVRLYRLVRRLRPDHILEFGTGIGLSTAVMALAVRENGSGRMTTLEQAPACLETARALIDPGLQERIEFILARPKAYQLPRVSRRLWWCGYDWDPDPAARFDFVFLDGPAGWLEGSELVSLDQGELFRLLPHLAPGALVYVDGRRSTVKQVERYLSFYLRLVERGSEHTIFARTDRPLASLEELEVRDAKLVSPGSPYASHRPH